MGNSVIAEINAGKQVMKHGLDVMILVVSAMKAIERCVL